MSSPDPLECPHGARCGGCAFLGVPYAEQLVHKGSLVRRAFLRYPQHAALRIEPVGGALPTAGYRVRAKLVWAADGALGLYARDSHAVVDIPECRVLAPALARVAHSARQSLRDSSLKLDGLDVQLVDRGVLVTLIATRGTPLTALEHAARALCAASPEVVGVAASFRDASAATLLGTSHVVLLGSDVEPHHLESASPYHLVAHGAFTQAHLGQALQAHRAIERALQNSGACHVLELYAGSGALSLRLAARGFSVTAVEAFAPALAHTERAAREQGLALRIVNGQAERVVRDLSARGERFDAVIVNPPRRGLPVDVRRGVAQLEPDAVLYMSCNPPTLARDLSHFRELGLAASELWPFDMIPHAEAVECLIVARRGAVPAPRIVHEDADLIAVCKSGYDGGLAQDGLLARVRRLPGAREAQPVAALDADSSGLALFARSAAALPALRRALADGGLTFSALARGVSHKKGRIRRPLAAKTGGASACTRYQREAVAGGHSLLKLDPEGGNAAQIRAHLSSVGHPILGDARYGDAASNAFFEHRHGLDRSFLHCSAARLALPSGTLTLDAPLPGELSAVLASLSQPAAPHR